MKLAVTYENGAVFQHFGHSEQFKIYDIADGEIKSSTVISTNGSGHGALADLLKKEGVDTLICGGIGGGAKNMLASAGIRLYGGVSGSADEAVAALLAGKLQFNPDIECAHHGAHDHGHDCHGAHDHGSHGCGGHTH
ncbi:NifB/NifX family molybdenum-iron cluster-binding protein [Ruminococcaceae bacterium OttesenSCG-928-D13]|nr:NifB/NifX family molybdenum-iron cluster-binding protein [Ruminococcaceae bacterium OttesenSCG-928-D13]